MKLRVIELSFQLETLVGGLDRIKSPEELNCSCRTSSIVLDFQAGWFIPSGRCKYCSSSPAAGIGWKVCFFSGWTRAIPNWRLCLKATWSRSSRLCTDWYCSHPDGSDGTEVTADDGIGGRGEHFAYCGNGHWWRLCGWWCWFWCSRCYGDVMDQSVFFFSLSSVPRCIREYYNACVALGSWITIGVVVAVVEWFLLDVATSALFRQNLLEVQLLFNQPVGSSTAACRNELLILFS